MSAVLTWYGHATLGLTIDQYRLLVDPFFTGNPAATTTASDVQADYILISHGHGDHVGDAVSIVKRTGATIISNFGTWNLIAQDAGVWAKRVESETSVKVHVLRPGGSFEL